MPFAFRQQLEELRLEALAATSDEERLETYFGDDDLRVDSGLLSRASRAIPYTRIHDINLEQGPLARVLGLVKVTFDTGTGGHEDVSLAYLKTSDGAALRKVVRARKDPPMPPGPDGLGAWP